MQANTPSRTSVFDTSRLAFESPVGWQAAVRRFKSGSTSFCRLPQHFFLFKKSRKRFEQSANPFQTPSMNTELSHPSSEFSHKHKEMRPSGNNMWIVLVSVLSETYQLMSASNADIEEWQSKLKIASGYKISQRSKFIRHKQSIVIFGMTSQKYLMLIQWGFYNETE